MEKTNSKIKLGQFFTKGDLWLKPQVKKFILNSKCSIAYDPFAGGGDLLKQMKQLGFKKIFGLDIDPKLKWKINDSLISIPKIANAIIVTNPPYLSNYSAARKGIISDIKKYFDSNIYDDLYLIALEKMLMAQKYVVAIIPETFLNSNFKHFNRLCSITVLEENPFNDTDTPVCVVCFDNDYKDLKDIKIYKNDNYVFTLKYLNDQRLHCLNNIPIVFNSPNGWLGLRAVDTTNPNSTITFDFKENFKYDWKKGIKISSRLLSTIDINIKLKDRKKFIDEANSILNNLRKTSSDLIFSPFKGNMKNGVRRRRLDYYTARAILEKAFQNIYGVENEQLRLF